MSKGGNSSPNPYTSAGVQTQSNIDSGIASNALNNVNVYSPYGSSTYGQTGTTNVGGYQIPQYSQNISLNPQQQTTLNSVQGAAGNLAGKIQNDSSGTYGLGKYTTGLQTGFNQGQQVQGQTGMPAGSEQAINDARNAAYNQQEAYLAPQQAQQGEQLNASLAQQGITQGSAAYNNAQSQQGRQNTFSNQQAQNAAVQAGQQEQNTLYGQSLQSGEFANTAAGQQFAQGQGAAQFANTAAGQGYAQQANIDNLPYNQFSQLGGIQNPQANAPAQSNINPSQIAQYIQQAYATNANSSANQMNGIYGLGSTLGAAGINYLAR